MNKRQTSKKMYRPAWASGNGGRMDSTCYHTAVPTELFKTIKSPRDDRLVENAMNLLF
jgi:hypothetical protein